jgi:hypothetical protein
MSRLPNTVKSSPSLLLPLTPGLDNYAPSSHSFSWCLAPTPWSKHSSPRAWLWSFYGRHSQPSWWRCEFTRASPCVNSFSVRCTPLRTRRRGQHGLQWRCADDYTIVVAWALAVGQATVSYIVSVKTWQGYHVYDIPDFSVDERVVAAKYDIANQLLYNPILALVKASIVFFLWRLEDRRKVIRWSLVSFFVLNLALAISTFVADLCQCTPVSYHWNKYRTDTYEVSGNVLVQTGTCINVINFFLITAGLSVLTDILIMIIPAAMVWGLKMNRSKKIAVWAVMSLGWVVVIVGVVRIALFITQSRPGNLDPTYSLGFTISGVEVNM